MLNVKLLRENIDLVAENLQKRGFELDVEKINMLESKRKTLQTTVERLQSERNSAAKAIGIAKASGEDITQLLESNKQSAAKLTEAEQELATLQNDLQIIYAGIPNIPHESVPNGRNEEDNLEIRRLGEPKAFNFEVLDHVALGEKLGLMDFELSAKITGSRFVVLKGKLARLQRALADFMLDLHTEQHGYQEVYVPHLVNHDSLYGTGQLPKFSEDLFHISGEFNYALIPTAEVPVTNFVRNTIVPEEELPLKFVAHTPCYRSEAGTYGKDMRGMIRQHQFEKVELLQMVHPEKSYDLLEELTLHAEKVLQLLELPYRVVSLCAGDLGFSSAKTYDLEVWLPSQNCYREISSCSNFEDFQARRMLARVRTQNSKKPEFLHTLNGSGVAVGRALVAIMENYQDEQGRIHIPKILQPYMNGLSILES
ncbi:MAG: serine--tRNA ligase [Gammaproteobacteria bacterium]|nr:serine--tRNA ligase [Gammaproteobacteria bacterium]